MRLVVAHEERGLLKEQLVGARRREQVADAKAAAQLALLRAALARANAQLKAAGGAPVELPGGGGRRGGEDQGARGGAAGAPGRLQPLVEQRSTDVAEGPSTPLSPGQAASKPTGSSSWDSSDACSVRPPLLCASPAAARGGGALDGGADGSDGEIDSPRSDLSGPSCSGGADEGATSRGAGALAGLARCASPAAGRPSGGGRLAPRDNPLFLPECPRPGGGRGSYGFGASASGGLCAVEEGGEGAAALSLAQAQLEIQLAQAQQRLGALQSAAAAAGGQAAGAQARLRAGVRCLENLHGLLKAAIEGAAGGGGGGAQVRAGGVLSTAAGFPRARWRPPRHAPTPSPCPPPARRPCAGAARPAGRGGGRPGAPRQGAARDGRVPRRRRRAAAAHGRAGRGRQRRRGRRGRGGRRRARGCGCGGGAVRVSGARRCRASCTALPAPRVRAPPSKRGSRQTGAARCPSRGRGRGCRQRRRAGGPANAGGAVGALPTHLQDADWTFVDAARSSVMICLGFRVPPPPH